MPIDIKKLETISEILIIFGALLIILYAGQSWGVWTIADYVLTSVAAFLGAVFLAVGLGGFIYAKVYRRPPTPAPPEETVVKPGIAMPYGPRISYSLVFPDGSILKVEGKQYKEFGRADFRGRVDPMTARLISKVHFAIKAVVDETSRSSRLRYYIKDLGSRNGTLLNGVDIRDRGWIEIKDGDIISPASTINLVFRIFD